MSRVYIDSMKKAITTALGLVLGLSLLTATAVSAEPTSRPMDFSTQMTPSFPFTDYAGAYLGSLHLVFAPDGTVSGWYRAQDAGPVQPVVGGRDGNTIWFDIGTQASLPVEQAPGGSAQVSGPLQVTGKLQNGHIVGTAQNGSSYLAFAAQQQPTSEQTQ